MEAEQKKDSSFGWKDFWIGVALGCAVGLIGTLFTKGASVVEAGRWAVIGVLGIFTGLSRRWRDAGSDLTSLAVGFSLALWVWISIAWEILPGLLPTLAGVIGFTVSLLIRRQKKLPASNT